MDKYLIFRTYIPNRELNYAKEDFNEDLVSLEGTLSDPGYCLEDYCSEDERYHYCTVLEVTKDGHLLAYVDNQGNIDLEQKFNRLRALPPNERWAEALEIVKEWAGAEIAALTGKEAPRSREEAAATLRQFLAERASTADEDTIRRASNMLFALAEDNSESYPFSRSVELFEHWHYLEDEILGDADIQNSVEAIAFVFVS
jgi:hypothetical protein